MSTTTTDVNHERLRDLIHGSLSCEFTTIRDGKPATYPVTPYYDDEKKRVIVSSAPAFAGKIENVKRNSKLALILHGESGEYLVTGDGRVHEDDLEANSDYEWGLKFQEPEGVKRSGNEKMKAFTDSWLGGKLMGWYTLRILVEIDPNSMVRLGDCAAVDGIPAWEAIDMDASEGRTYERAVLSVIDDDGYPASTPLTSLSIENGNATFDSNVDVEYDDGQPACLLVHWQGEEGDTHGQRVIRGRLSEKTGTPTFSPSSSFVTTLDNGLDRLKMVVNGRRRTKDYYRGRS